MARLTGRAAIRAAKFTVRRALKKGIELPAPKYTIEEKAIYKQNLIATRRAAQIAHAQETLASKALQRPPPSHLTQAVNDARMHTVERHRLWPLLNNFRYDGVGLKVRRDVWDKWEEPCYYTVTKTKRKVSLQQTPAVSGYVDQPLSAPLPFIACFIVCRVRCSSYVSFCL